ncbi:TIGR03089 family protein [Amycolatopsis cihanbeyliensis]|uniref:Uncharacterized protein (TIGR03089 family) n=1 Tax=Amycolatopsis cihanbeyliensis TaxID=1128664 RepID=A0A542DNV6_AMYCI|nr:TIGR03089 family protein [Amycolatopsis cihanbeyliensis]TQJ04783.1 uncharacterized protein (TIGR03089 family) [Amycolatopsis cihanbeyliensis]
MSLTEHLLRPLLSSSAARPVITHYDDAAGSRVELSVATLANWAAKTANWLVEELDVEQGDEVAVRLPAHWQTAGVLLGAWWCGARVTVEDTAAAVAFVGPAAAPSAARETAVVALDPLGRGLAEPPAEGAHDYLTESRLAGDEFSPLLPVPGDAPALLDSTVDELIAEARSRAGKLGIGNGDRVLSTIDWQLPGGVVDGLLAPLAAGAHLVQVTGADPAKLADRRSTERTTIDLLG